MRVLQWYEDKSHPAYYTISAMFTRLLLAWWPVPLVAVFVIIATAISLVW